MALQEPDCHLQIRTLRRPEGIQKASLKTEEKGPEKRELPSQSGQSNNAPSGTLKRELGFFSAIAVVIGNVVGTGIFVTPSLVFSQSGSTGADLLIWFAAGAVALIQVFCLAELGALIPASGGNYAFLCAAGDTLGRLGDFIPFMYAWCRILVTDPMTGTFQGLAFASYALQVVYSSCVPPYSVTVLVAFTFCTLATALNGVSLGVSSKIQNILVVAKIALLLSIVGTAVVAAFTGKVCATLGKKSRIRPGFFPGLFFSACSL